MMAMTPPPIEFAPLATGALAFTVALAWNDAVSQTIRGMFPGDARGGAARATILYALAVTLLVIAVTMCINWQYARMSPALKSAPEVYAPKV